MNLAVSDIAKALDAQIIGVDAGVNFSRVSTDSRAIRSGDLFVALKGDNFNGHRFVEKAVESGACGVVVSEQNDNWSQRETVPQLLVKDTLVALGQLGVSARRQFTGSLIALTGSSGKTTVKEMIIQIMKTMGSTHGTEKNFNNEIGVPMTLLSIKDNDEYAVLELGASRAGDISYLRKMVNPDIVLVNNVLPAHLEGFGSIDGVAQAKGEIYDDLPAQGKAIINVDEPYAQQWKTRIGDKEVLSFSMNETSHADFYPSSIESSAHAQSFQLQTPQGAVPIKLQAIGRHNINNALAAAAASYAAGATLDNIQHGLNSFMPVKGRLFVMKGLLQCTLIDDTYNANPGSVRSAIDTLSSAHSLPGDKTLLILGDMGELGDAVMRLHHDIGVYAKTKNIYQLLTVGQHSLAASRAFGTNGQHFTEQSSLIEYCKSIAGKEMVFLVKGSRSAHMENVVNALSQASVSNALQGGDD